MKLLNLLTGKIKRSKEVIETHNENTIYSEMVYKYEKDIEDISIHNNLIIRFIISKDTETLMELLKFLLTEPLINIHVVELDTQLHVLLGGQTYDFERLITNSDPTNKFFKELIGLLYYTNQSTYISLIANDVMNADNFVNYPNNERLKLTFKMATKNENHTDIIIDDIDYIYNKLNGLFSYKVLTNFAKVSFVDINDGEPYTMSIKTAYKYDHIIDIQDCISGDIQDCKIPNYLSEYKDETKYSEVDETMSDPIEEEFLIIEDEEGNLSYNEDNFL